MANPHLLQEVYEAVTHLLDKVMNEQDQIVYPLPDDIDERLERLFETVEQLSELTQTILKEEGLSEEYIAEMKKKPKNLPQETWEMILSMRDARIEALKFERKLRQRQAKNKGEEPPEGGPARGNTEKDSPEQRQARKRKFDQLKGRQNWRPI